MYPLVASLDDISLNDVAHYGGKNASLGEMRRALTASGVLVPGGFATSSDAYRLFLEHNQLNDLLKSKLENLDVENLQDLTRAGKAVREALMAATLPEPLVKAVREAHAKMLKEKSNLTVAVRSSATAEDLPDASFAG